MTTPKKDLNEMGVDEKLKNLYQLQTILSEIDKLRTLRGELPEEVKDLEDEIAGLTTRMNHFRSDREGMLLELEVMQNKAKEAQEAVDRYNEQISDVQNNREYDILSKEIEYQTLEIQFQNKKMGQFRQNIETKDAEIEQCSTMLEERRKDLDIKKAELDEISAETKAEEERLRIKAGDVESRIESRLLAAFKRIRNNSRNGLGIVYVERGACGGCFNKIPPQRQLDIRMNKKIIVCEYCGRIMIDPELAGVKVEQPEEKPRRRTRKSAAK